MQDSEVLAMLEVGFSLFLAMVMDCLAFAEHLMFVW